MKLEEKDCDEVNCGPVLWRVDNARQGIVRGLLCDRLVQLAMK